MRCKWNWLRQIRNRWIRGRQGWCPEDVWSLDVYLARVLAGSLAHLANTTHGTPMGYPDLKEALPDDITHINSDPEQWRADLRRWAAVFAQYTVDSDTYACSDTKAVEQTLKEIEYTLEEMAPWFGSLWD